MLARHRFARASLVAAAALGLAAALARMAAPRSGLAPLLLTLGVLAALPPAALALRWAWRKLTYRVGVRLFVSYALIGLTPFAICGAATFIAAYVAVGQYAATRVRAEMGRLDDRLAVRADAAVAELSAGRPERARGLLGAAEPSGLCVEWVLSDGEREWRSDGAAAVAAPRWVGEGGWQGDVVAGEAAFRAAVARRGAAVAAVLVPLDLANARAFPAASWYEVRFLTDLRTSARDGGTGTVTVAERGAADAEPEFRINGRPAPASEVEPGWLSADHVGATRWARLRTLWMWVAASPRDVETGEPRERAIVLTAIKLSPRGALDDMFGPGERLGGDMKGVATVLGGFLAAVYVIACGFAVVMVLSVARSTARLTRGARAVTGGDLDHRIPVKRRDQLGDLAVSFNAMTDSVRAMLAQVAERERLAREMELAREIQESLLPPTEMTAGPLSVWAHFRPATEVGGDYFDLFPLPSGRLLVAVGDVAGHGLHTGILMAMVKSAVATLVQEGHAGRPLLERLNRLLLAQPIRHRMVSLALAEVDVARGTVEITSAGHPPGMLLALGGDVEELLVASLPLGHRWPEPPATRTRPFSPGSRLLLYSDGLVEARAADGRAFGYEALRAVLAAEREAPAATLIAKLLEALDRHLDGEAMADDLTLLLVERRA